MKISEIFHSIQGEGPHAGGPALFLRLSGCPLPHCSFCDTAYARGPESGQEMKPEEIMERVLAMSANSHNGSIGPGGSRVLANVVITGGEPFYLWSGEHEKLLSLLKRHGGKIFFETSGKVAIPHIKGATIVASPKYYRGKGWDFLRQNIKRASYFKFVLHDRADLNRINSFIAENRIPLKKIFLMPGGKNRKSVLESGKWVFQEAVKLGYGFSPRLHIMLFGNKRGI